MNVQVLTKQVERHHCLSQSSFAKEYPNQNELQDFQENMHYEIQETTKASKEISLHVERVLDELQKLKHITSQASSRSSHKKSKRAIQKYVLLRWRKRYLYSSWNFTKSVNRLKIQGETLLLEKKHFEDTSHILEEKCRSLAMEKELLLHQLDECQNKLGAILKDEQATKVRQQSSALFKS